jgi:hypothetical protein
MRWGQSRQVDCITRNCHLTNGLYAALNESSHSIYCTTDEMPIIGRISSTQSWFLPGLMPMTAVHSHWQTEETTFKQTHDIGKRRYNKRHGADYGG